MDHKKGKKTIKQLSDEVAELTNIVKVLQHELEQLKTKYVSGHDKSMERGPSEKIKCHECNQALENLKALKRHTQKQHQKCYKCNHCNFEAATVSGIDEHIKANHATENVLNCDDCDKTFKSEIRLKIHKNIHQ